MIGLKGIKIGSVSITRDSEGKENVTGDYSLMSTNDKVLAKQGFNGYNEIKVSLSHETQKALDSFLSGIKDDCLTILGLREDN